MTLQEAIKQLKLNSKWDYVVDDDLKAFKVAIAALEKQIPKKLIRIENEKCCPICKEEICLIGDDGNYGNYCLNCGQALDWSEK